MASAIGSDLDSLEARTLLSALPLVKLPAWDATPIAVGDTVYLYSDALWKTDGSPAGTKLLMLLGQTIHDPVAFHNSLYFGVSTPGELSFLWRSGGTNGTTVKFWNDFVVRASDPDNAVVFKDRLFFSGSDLSHGTEMWSTSGENGSAGVFKDINAENSSTVPSFQENVVVDDTLFFRSEAPNFKYHLWKSDGTPAGTMPTDLPAFEQSFHDLVSFKNQAFFLFNNQLWRTDGTTGGSAVVKEFDAEEGYHFLYRLKPALGELFFADGFSRPAADGTINLWRSDGTTDGTTALTHFQSPGWISAMTPMADALYFVANMPNPELWKTDGTAEGTVLVKRIAEIETGETRVSTPIAVNKTLYFASADSSGHFQLWTSDGTADGTRAIGNLPRSHDEDVVTPASLAYVNGDLYITVPGNNTFVLRAKNPKIAITNRNRVINVTGTSGTDIISIKASYYRIRVDANGVVRTFYRNYPRDASKIVIHGGDGDDAIFLSRSSPMAVIDGGDGNDRILCHGADCIVHGSWGDDTIVADNGSDQLFGEDGNDSIVGGKGNDLLRGGFGDDSLRGGMGTDQLFGEGGSDVFYAEKLDADRIDGGAGVDSVIGVKGDKVIDVEWPLR